MGHARQQREEEERRSRSQGGRKDHTGLTFVYPYGSSLNVQKPAISLLSSGHVAYPLNRPLAACAESDEGSNPAGKGGRLAAVGSVQMFADEWISKEDNDKILEVLLKWLSFDEAIVWDHADAQDPDTNEYHNVPNTAVLSERPRSCLQEPESIPKAFSELFAGQLYGMDTKVCKIYEKISPRPIHALQHIPAAVEATMKLDGPKAALTIIPPQFERPLPKLEPATFPPVSLSVRFVRFALLLVQSHEYVYVYPLFASGIR